MGCERGQRKEEVEISEWGVEARHLDFSQVCAVAPPSPRLRRDPSPTGGEGEHLTPRYARPSSARLCESPQSGDLQSCEAEGQKPRPTLSFSTIHDLRSTFHLHATSHTLYLHTQRQGAAVQVAAHVFALFPCFVQGGVGDAAACAPDHHAFFAFHEGKYSGFTEARGQHAVTGNR